MPAESKLKTTAAVLRATIGLRDREMAELLGCSVNTIWSLESGRLKLSESMAVKMAHETGVSAIWLLAGDPKKKPFIKRTGHYREVAMPFTKEKFEEYAAGLKYHDHAGEFQFSRDFISFASRLRRILHVANRAHTYHMARYKVGLALDRLADELNAPPHVDEEEEALLKDFKKRSGNVYTAEQAMSQVKLSTIRDPDIRRIAELYRLKETDRPESDDPKDIARLISNDADRFEASTTQLRRLDNSSYMLDVEDISKESISQAGSAEIEMQETSAILKWVRTVLDDESEAEDREEAKKGVPERVFEELRNLQQHPVTESKRPKKQKRP